MQELERRLQRVRQKQDLIKLSQSYQEELVALRVKWGIPQKGFSTYEEMGDWRRALTQWSDVGNHQTLRCSWRPLSARPLTQTTGALCGQ